MTLIDADQRAQATNPCASFIVQAPAGSGKTEILTQRFLRLLSTVSAPEQIIALTFTRKAASEMRERIVIALQAAAMNKPTHSAHQQMTQDFAKQALRHSEIGQWDLLRQPNRLRIITIDALCQTINQAIPLMEKQIAYSSITDKPATHYLNASRRCIQFALENPDYQQAIKTLLLHVDNKQERLLLLFTTLLSQRDQWLAFLFQARGQDKASFEQALAAIEQHELDRFKRSLPVLLSNELMQLACEVATIENNPDSPRYFLREAYAFNQSTQKTARALSALLLTGEGKFRQAFDHHVGLKRGVCADEQYVQLKARSKTLLTELNDYPDFIAALLQVSHLPQPQYDPEQWDVLQALFLLLPLLVGHLSLCFSEHNEVDFTAISQQALSALGETDNPTDLALYLDNAIHHLLIDEFQDTSITQFELLTQLVQGWQPGDGKTLFVVGDPMQSIYRFRQAEVGLFFRAKEQGIGAITLQSLALTCNFRSTETLVNWVNHHFATLFPQHVDIESGAVSFHPSVNVIKGDEHSQVRAMQFKHREQEATSLIQFIQEELASDSEKSLAILVRSRNQLVEIIRLLRHHQIPYQGTDIDLLANLFHLRDLWSLTQALLSPANRLSWLAMLRSPYCGLSLNDIHCIASSNPKKSIFLSLQQLDTLQGMSEEGRVRAVFFTHVMQDALTNRYQDRLSDWVIHTAKALHLDSILNESQLKDLEQFWALLDRYEADGRLPDIQAFQKELNKLYAQQATPSRLQVMTIHKSKGLEFDTVFLPGLGSQPNRGDNPMLRWLKLPTQEGDNLLLVSPIQAAHNESCALYDYLGQIEAEKSAYEAQRLLYVAVTRAKSRLYLMDSSSKTAKNSFHSLLKHQEFIAHEEDDLAEQITLSPPKLYQLPLAYYTQNKAAPAVFLNAKTPDLAEGIPRLTGIVAHQLLQWICDNHPQSPSDVPWSLARYELKKTGFDQETQEEAFKLLHDQITTLFACPKGKWIIAQHDKEANEYELLVKQNNKTATRIIDRSFEENGIFWIIDFKTGKETDHTRAKHQEQLNEYAKHIACITPLPIQCGLYYLPHAHWVQWQITHEKDKSNDY